MSKLREHCEKLISYWKRNRFNWQLEKAEDFLRAIDEALSGGEISRDDEMTLRRLLFLEHSCELKYGDDGEMQCSKCFIDFKRDSVVEIERKLDERTTKNMVDYISKSQERV